MGNPYQYTGKGEGFLTDYSNLAAAGSAFNSFADAYQKARHQQAQDQEMEAKMKALQGQESRAADEQAIRMHKERLIKNQDGSLGYRPMDDTEKLEHNAKLFGEGGMQDPNDPTKVITDPSTPKATAARNAGINQSNRISSKEKLAAQATYNKDPLLNAFIPRLEGAQKILNLIGAARGGDVKANQAVLGQLNAEIARLETGSQSPGLHASEKTELEDKLAQYQNIRDTWSGKVTSVDLGDKFDASEALVRDLGHSINDSVERRHQFLAAGATDAQKETYNEKGAVLHSQYGGRFNPLPKKQTMASQESPSFFGRLGGLVGFGPAAQAKAPPSDLEVKANRLRELDAKAGK